MGAPGTLIPAEISSSQLQNCGFAVRGCAEIVGLPNSTNVMLDAVAGVPVVLSDHGRMPTVGRFQTELLDMGYQTKPDEVNHSKVNEKGIFEHTKAYECSHTESSHAENMHVKNVSNYVRSAAQNPEFGPELHRILFESGASPPPDLFSDINPRDWGREAVQSDPNRLLLSYEKSLINSQGVGSARDTWSCQSADRLAGKQKQLHTDAIECSDSSQGDNTSNGILTVSDRDNGLEQSNPLTVDCDSINTRQTCKEKCVESSLPNAVLSCKRHNGVDCYHDDDENGLRNKVGASFKNSALGKDSAIQINEMVNGDCTLHDDQSKKISSVLGEGTDWEIQWEELRIGERIGIGKFVPRL